ncbi:MAG: sec-independent protein translocase protein TatC [Verrucomicrobiota bacterium]
MADEPIAEHLDVPEEEGGPVKSFLEHLEDLRWMLIKSGVFAAVAMLICLLGGNHVVRILERPLMNAPMRVASNLKVMRVLWGTNQLGVFELGTNDSPGAVFGTNQFVNLQIVPITIGTNQVLGINVQDDPQGQKGHRLPIDIVILSPAGAFVVATKVAFYAGLVLASPFIFYFVAQFVFPALRMREKKYVYRGLAFGFCLFAMGVCFCYFALMPVALAASAQYTKWFGFSATQWRAEEYIGFVCKFMLGMGLGFELPVIVLTLVKIGVLNYRMLASARRYVIVISFVLGAVLTTPEVITQVLMAIPLLLLYEISVWIAWYWERQDKKREAASVDTGA